MSSRQGGRTEISCPFLPDRRRVCELRLLFTGDQEDRTVDSSAGRAVDSVVVPIEPEARTVVRTDRGDRRLVQRSEVLGEGIGADRAWISGPGLENETEEAFAFGGDQTLRKRRGLGEQKPRPVSE